MNRFSRTVLCLAAMLIPVSISGPALADAPLRKVTVVGTAIIKVVPDEMHWVVAVGANGATAASAKETYDASLTAALKYLKSLGGAIKDLQTDGIQINKINYTPPIPPDAKPFTYETRFTFTLTDFDKYGPIIDALAKLNGFQVQSVDYASSNADATRRDALKQALLNAHDKANDLAVTAGCYVDKPLEIIEGTPDNGPRPMMAMARAPGGIGTPAAVPGQIEISAAITATYDLYYK